MVSTPCPDLRKRDRVGSEGRWAGAVLRPKASGHAEVSQATLVDPFPMSHIRPYSHLSATRALTGGEAGGASDRKNRCTMATNSGDNPESKFLTVAEVAAMMRVSKMTVYRLVHNGELPAVRVGRSFRVREDDVDEYLRKSFYNAG
jgi:excisionase family DNA binding protein